MRWLPVSEGRMTISDLDVVFISYDEPRADEFFANLQTISHQPPKRVHGVKGFDAAHKAAAMMAGTERFITVDADNLVKPDFFVREHLTAAYPVFTSDYVCSFTAMNTVNGLAYGNGGIKIWPRELLLKVDTHENAEGSDFCWTYRYWQINDTASDVYFHSPYHAFRSGYREAVKLSLVTDQKLASWKQTMATMYPPNLSRLLVWASVGSDKEFGEWSIYGARRALHDIWYKNLNPDRIRDYDWFATLWDRTVAKDMRNNGSSLLAEWLENLLDLDLPDLTPKQSSWFKSVYLNTERHGPMIPNMKSLL